MHTRPDDVLQVFPAYKANFRFDGFPRKMKILILVLMESTGKPIHFRKFVMRSVSTPYPIDYRFGHIIKKGNVRNDIMHKNWKSNCRQSACGRTRSFGSAYPIAKMESTFGRERLKRPKRSFVELRKAGHGVELIGNAGAIKEAIGFSLWVLREPGRLQLFAPLERCQQLLLRADTEKFQMHQLRK